MILRSIRLTNVRRFIEPVEVRGIGPGLNVLAAPNEDGKSTIFDALHAVFFRDRKSRHKRVRSLKPYAGGDPEVEVEIELSGEAYRIQKIWKGARGAVKIFRRGTVIRHDDEAEDWIRSVLLGPESGGPAGLLWVRQGQAGLDRGSKKESDSAQLARKNLLASVVSGEVDAMTGGRRMEVARKACREELAQYVTGTGKDKKSGPLARKKDNVGTLRERHAQWETVSHRLRDALVKRRQQQNELKRLEDPQEDAERRARLKAAEREAESARRHASLLERAKLKERAKRQEVGRKRERYEALLKNLQELENARKALATADKVQTEAAEDLAAKEKALASAEAERKEAQAQAQAASRVLRLAEQKENIALQDELRRDVVKRLEQAERARKERENAYAEKAVELPARAGAELEQLAVHVDTLRGLQDREAAALTVTYLQGCEGKVTLEGSVLEHDVRVSIPSGAQLGIKGVGTLTVYPDQRVDNTSLEEAEKRLRELLLKHELDGIASARASLRRRHNAEDRRRDAEALLRSVAPKGIVKLKEQLAALPENTEEVEDAPPRAEAATREEQAHTRRDVLAGASDRQRGLFTYASNRAAQTSQALVSARARLARAQAALQGLDSPDKEARRQEEVLQSLSEELQALERSCHDIDDSAPDMDAVTSGLNRAQSVVDRARTDKEYLCRELAKLDVLIKEKDGDAVEEKLEDVKEQLADAEKELRHTLHEVAVLGRLDRALKVAQESARDQYVAPVLKELVPLTNLLWPEAKMRFDADNILPEALVREGTEEGFDVLSGGTQEQIAILVRLAFARILASSGSPAPVIFDDAIVYTDDNRIEVMFDALTRQARDFQIIVLSCRQKAFMGLGGTSLHIKPVQAA